MKYYKNYSQIDVLDPNGHLEKQEKKKQMKHFDDINFRKENKLMLHKIQSDIIKSKIEQQNDIKIKMEEEQFKMERFKGIKSKLINNTKVPKYDQNLQENKENNLNLIEQKYYIKRNMSQVKEINKITQQNLKEQYNKVIEKSFIQNEAYGKLPKYIQTLKFKQDQEAEQKYVTILKMILQYSLFEIEMNKRPQGTRYVNDDERREMLRKLTKEKKLLQKQIQQMSVTLYTIRAQNQMKGFIDKMNEIDKSIDIFSRKKCYLKE